MRKIEEESENIENPIENLAVFSLVELVVISARLCIASSTIVGSTGIFGETCRQKMRMACAK